LSIPISSYAEKQIERTKILFRAKRRTKKDNIAHAIPIILTLYSMDVELIDGVPIVPISKFKSFIEEVYPQIDYQRQKTRTFETIIGYCYYPSWKVAIFNCFMLLLFILCNQVTILYLHPPRSAGST
jgi:hypothetical protein